MKLKRLIVKHVGVFRGTRAFDLDQELVVIYGSNFSGKTTLVRALYFALCGDVLPRGIHRKTLVSTNEQNATAGCVYTHENSEYRIYRSTRGELKIEHFDRQTWRQLSENRLILPDLNAHQWQMSCFLQEDELGDFLTKTPATSRRMLQSVGVVTTW